MVGAGGEGKVGCGWGGTGPQLGLMEQRRGVSACAGLRAASMEGQKGMGRGLGSRLGTHTHAALHTPTTQPSLPHTPILTHTTHMKRKTQNCCWVHPRRLAWPDAWSHCLLAPAQVEFDPALTSPEALVEAVEDAGFDGGLISVARPPAAAAAAAAAGGGGGAGAGALGQLQGGAQVRARGSRAWGFPCMASPRMHLACMAHWTTALGNGARRCHRRWLRCGWKA